jgi:hypothetical protein
VPRPRRDGPAWLPLKTFDEMYISHPKGMMRAGDALGDPRLRATRWLHDRHCKNQLEVRVYKPTAPRLIGPDEYEYLDAEGHTLYRLGWDRWPGVEVRWVAASPAIIAELVAFLEGLGPAKKLDAYTAARAKLGSQFTTREFAEARRQMPEHCRVGPWGCKMSVT